MSKFFIHRPIFAIVISLIIVIAGSIAATQLPIAQYPQISPPTVSVSTSYTGASAAVVNQTVAQIVEDQVNGTQGMDYMSSTSDDTGCYSLSVTFEVGTDGDMDSVKVQNNVASATSQLPSEVQQVGVTTKKSTNDMAYMMSFYSPDGTYDRAFMKNYATIYLLDKLKRINGVGDVQVFGSDYAMRVWLNPDKLAELGLTVADVSAAIKEQNVQAPAGTVGAMPVNNGQEKQMSGKIEGRLTTPEEFGNVIIKSNGDFAYFAADIAYYWNKRHRAVDPADVAIYMLGADHHGYIGRMMAMCAAFGDEPGVNMQILIGQLVNVMKNGKPVRMSKRAGNVVTIDDLVEAVGVDAARYSLARTDYNTSVDIDLDLLTSHSNENPVYYVQYAHARICSVLTQWQEQGGDPAQLANVDLTSLTSPAAEALLLKIAQYPDMLHAAATDFAPHDVTFYLRELASVYHSYYDAERILADDPLIRQARLALVAATAQVLRNGLCILGVSAPEKM